MRKLVLYNVITPTIVALVFFVCQNERPQEYIRLSRVWGEGRRKKTAQGWWVELRCAALVPVLLFAALLLMLASCTARETAAPDSSATAAVSTDWMAGHENDAALFAGIYPVSEDNPFLIASFEEVVRLFEIGKGVLVFGFPDCPRCKNAFPVLEKAFKEMKMHEYEGFTGKILYYDIFDDRAENNERYQALVEYTKEFLPLDDSGNPRIYSPDVFFVNAGTIIGNHLDTVPSLTNPRDSLNEEQETELMQIYMDLIKKMEDCLC